MNFYKIGSFILFSREFSYFYIEERKRRKNNMANYNPYSTQFFPQSQGNVYIINNSMEIANIPIIPIVQFLLFDFFYLKQIFQFQ